jgi:hypothetical protein
MSIAFLDPGNSISLYPPFIIFISVAGDLEAGNFAGYSLLWALLSATCIALFF